MGQGPSLVSDPRSWSSLVAVHLKISQKVLHDIRIHQNNSNQHESCIIMCIGETIVIGTIESLRLDNLSQNAWYISNKDKPIATY